MNTGLADYCRLRLIVWFGAIVASSLSLADAGPISAVAVASEGRAYEMVSPLYKGGYAANPIDAVAPDGEGVVFSSQGAFSGAPSSPGINEYLARRGASSWSTTPLIAPATLLPAPIGNEPIDFSPTLSSSLTHGKSGADIGSASRDRTKDTFFIHSTDVGDVAVNYQALVSLTAVNNIEFGVSYKGASQDFSHLLLNSSGSEPLISAAVGSENQLYDVVTTGQDANTVRLVGVNNAGEVIDQYCPVTLGSEFGKASEFNAIAAKGSEIFFTTNADKAFGDNCDGLRNSTYPENPAILYVRVEGQRTIELSTPIPADCPPTQPQASCHVASQARAEFQGANEDGSCVFFTTSQPLVTGDSDTGNDLYMATMENPESGATRCQPSIGKQAPSEVTSLTQVSRHPSGGEAAEVQGVVAISSSGSRVYFVAHGLLSDGPNAEGQTPISGADNLYLYDTRSDASPVFIQDLCSGPEFSGEQRDAHCPANLESPADSELWSKDGQKQTAEDGRFLLFASYGQLTPDDKDSARDIYRYDAITGELDRVSIGEAGAETNGNDSRFDATIHGEMTSALVSAKAGLSTRSISEDGTRAIFTTAGPLSTAAINGLVNAYEWHKEPGWTEGKVSLISTGNSNERVDEAMMSPDGRDVFFVTSQGLVSQDTDGAPDVYDARLGGGFLQLPTERQQCSSDACQGALSVPNALLVPGSAVQAPGGNYTPLVSKSVPKKKIASKKVRTKKKAKKHRTRRAARRSNRGHGSSKDGKK